LSSSCTSNFHNSIVVIFVLGLILNIPGFLSIGMNNHSDIGLLSFLTNISYVNAQEISSLISDNSSRLNEIIDNNNDDYTELRNDSSIVKAKGHFANNQIQDNVVTWIQGGLWNLDIKELENKSKNTSNMTATFNANFTMIKPDGSLSHNHVIDNFLSENVIFAGNDVVITGISNIHTDNATEYSQVPITVHLMGKKVLGLMIDVNKTGGHFSGSNEMFGTLISGFGLESSITKSNSNNNNNAADNQTLSNSNNPSERDSLNHSIH